jgi:hypothetical protein
MKQLAAEVVHAVLLAADYTKQCKHTRIFFVRPTSVSGVNSGG